MKNMNKFSRSMMEYGFVLILTLMSAADKIFIHPTKDWWGVMGIVVWYYVVITISGILEMFLDRVMIALKKREIK